MAQEAMFRIGAAVKVQDDAISLNLHRRNDNTVAGGRRLALLVDHLSVLCGTGSELPVRLKCNTGADWKSAMGEALLGLKVANQFAAAAFRELSPWQGHV